MYSIYHIPTFVHKDGSIGKIGCTVQKPINRVKEQGYQSFEILETHDCIDSVSVREQELQKEYGYKIDIVPYKVSVKNRQPWNDKTRYKVWLDPIAIARSHTDEINKVKIEKLKQWHKKDNYKTSIQNIKGVTKHRILSPKQEEFIKKTLFRRKNQHTLIPKGKHTTNELAKMFNIAPYLILKSYNRD